jgi:hypothetical protein
MRHGLVLHGPVVAVGILEEEERVPRSAGRVDPDTLLNVLDRADLNAPLNQFGSSGLEVSHDQL